MDKICPKHVELILEINKTVIVASRWFLYYLTYIDDARSNTNQVYKRKNLRNSAKWRHNMQFQLGHCNLVTDLSKLQRSTLAFYWMILRKILRWFLCKPCKLSFYRAIGGCAVCSTGCTTLRYSTKINWRLWRILFLSKPGESDVTAPSGKGWRYEATLVLTFVSQGNETPLPIE